MCLKSLNDCVEFASAIKGHNVAAAARKGMVENKFNNVRFMSVSNQAISHGIYNYAVQLLLTSPILAYPNYINVALA